MSTPAPTLRNDNPEKGGVSDARDRVAAALHVVPSPVAPEVFDNPDVTTADLRSALQAIIAEDEKAANPDPAHTSQAVEARHVFVSVAEGDDGELQALKDAILANERLAKRVAAKVRRAKGIEKPVVAPPAKAAEAPLPIRVMVVIENVRNRQNRISFIKAALEAVGRDTPSLKPQVDVILRRPGVLERPDELAQAMKSPELRTAFVAAFESVARQAEAAKKKEAVLSSRSATPMQLNAHLAKVGKGSEKQVRRALTQMAQGHVIPIVHEEAAQFVRAFGGERDLRSARFDLLLKGLRFDQYPHLRAALIAATAIPPAAAEKKFAPAAPASKAAPIKQSVVAPVEKASAAPKTPREALNAVKNALRDQRGEAFYQFIRDLQAAVPSVSIPEREGRGAAITEAMKQLTDAQVAQLLAEFGTKAE